MAMTESDPNLARYDLALDTVAGKSYEQVVTGFRPVVSQLQNCPR